MLLAVLREHVSELCLLLRFNMLRLLPVHGCDSARLKLVLDHLLILVGHFAAWSLI